MSRVLDPDDPDGTKSMEVGISLSQKELQGLAIAQLKATGRIPSGDKPMDAPLGDRVVDVWTSGSQPPGDDTIYTLKFLLREGETVKGGPIKESDG